MKRSRVNGLTRTLASYATVLLVAMTVSPLFDPSGPRPTGSRPKLVFPVGGGAPSGCALLAGASSSSSEPGQERRSSGVEQETSLCAGTWRFRTSSETCCEQAVAVSPNISRILKFG